jgi:hypothetical protein
MYRDDSANSFATVKDRASSIFAERIAPKRIYQSLLDRQVVIPFIDLRDHEFDQAITSMLDATQHPSDRRLSVDRQHLPKDTL